jgi:Flp pilus assembly protein TadB
MNNPQPPPTAPQDPDEVARRQARLEQMQMESHLEILRTRRQQRESGVNRRFTFFLVFALSGGVAWVLDHKGYKPEVSILGCVLTIVVVGGLWAFRKPY